MGSIIENMLSKEIGNIFRTFLLGVFHQIGGYFERKKFCVGKYPGVFFLILINTRGYF